MIYYEISFPLTLVKISLFMFFSISISLKTSNIFENKLQVFGGSENQKILSRKNTY